VGTVVGLLVFSFDSANVGTEIAPKIKKRDTKLAENLFENLSLAVFLLG
jgi:hypothetical protein